MRRSASEPQASQPQVSQPQVDQPQAGEPQSFGKFVRELRQQMGLTQEKLAAQLGVSFSTLNRWENEHSRPSPLAREKLEQLKQQMGLEQRLIQGQDES